MDFFRSVPLAELWQFTGLETFLIFGFVAYIAWHPPGEKK